MALDELIGKQLGVLQGYTIGTLIRWRDAANAARASAFTIDALFQVFREQFVDNWDTWNVLMALPLAERLPTVALRGVWNDLAGKAQGAATVNRRLTGATFDKLDLKRLGGTDTITAGMYTVTVAGDFDGNVVVTMASNLTTAPAATDVYFGPLLARFPGEQPAPIAWIAVVVTP